MSHAGCVQIVDFVQVCEQVRRRFQGSKVSGAWCVGTRGSLLEGVLSRVGLVTLSLRFVELVGG